MQRILIFIVILLVLLIVYVVWQRQELSKFQETHYEISSSKLKGAHTWLVLSDIHLWQYGKNNERLIEAVRRQKPDLILLPGDLIVSTKAKKYDIAQQLCSELVKIAPVYMSNGNHESRVEQPEHPNHEAYMHLKNTLTELGVHILNNQYEYVTVGDDRVLIYGLELPLAYYHKGKILPWQDGELESRFGAGWKDYYQILLAHTPKYTEEYLKWGADLSLSGHYHGGLVCLPRLGSIISPQFEFFPKYSFGSTVIGEQLAVTSRGLGTHTFHIRIFNRAELVILDIRHKS